MNLRSVSILLFLMAAVLPVWAQTPDASVKLRLAQSFERSGDWERAVPIYESLLFGEPQNFVYYDALRRGYIQLKEYDKAIELIRYRLTLQPDSHLLLSSLGGVYYQKGEEQKADSVWQAILRSNPSNVNLYRMIAGQMMEYRLYDQAISLFLQARQVTGDANLFTGELANLYGAFQQYENAAREYVRLLTQQPSQLADIQSRMSLFLNRPEAVASATKALQEALDARGNLIPLRQLYAWILMEGKDYSAALDQFRIIDRSSNARGVELFNFAQRALEERELGTAVKAYQEVLSISPPKEIQPAARLGLARATEELSIAIDSTLSPGSGESWPVSETRPSIGSALGLFEAIIRDYPGTPIAAQAYFRIGVIKRDRSFDLDGAFAAFASIPTIVPDSPLALEGSLAAAGVLIARNDLAAARNRYIALLGNRDPLQRDRVLFHLAEIDYFTASFDTALSVLKRLSLQSSTDLANNALELRYFIEENIGTSTQGLKLFAASDLLMRQRRYPEALEGFREVVRQFPAVLLVDDATIRIGELQLLLEKPLEAVNTFRSMVSDMTASILRDRALMRIGEIYEQRLNNPVLAIEVYEELLKLFPMSLYAEEARRRMRRLRGDVI
ncbi:MAG: tetratricopeptide repeat protein [Bacteroidota bacterium]